MTKHSLAITPVNMVYSRQAAEGNKTKFWQQHGKQCRAAVTATPTQLIQEAAVTDPSP